MQRETFLSRRRALALTGASLAGMAALAGCKSEPETPQPAAPERVSITVYDPTGAMEITQQFSPRLDTLEGKTIAFVADDEWEDHRTFPMIKEHLESVYHCTVLDYTNWPYGIAEITRADRGIPDMLHAAGADAAIVGNAG